MYDIMHLPQVIELGKTGENDFTKLEFDLRPWLQVLPEGVASIVHIRPGETSAGSYIATTTFEDGILTWIPNNADLGTVEGYGQMEIWLEEEVASPGTNKRGKSVKVQTFVQAGIGTGEADPPEPQESWIEQMTELKTATVNAKDAAVLAQTGAETAEGNAEAWAVGQRGGVDVESTDPTYHNNSKYYSQQSAGSATDADNAKTAAEAAKDGAQAAVRHYPYVDSTTGDWMVWDGIQGTFVDTGIHAKGDTGEVPDISIGTVTTVEPDQQASVTRRSGSPDTAPIFDFSIPRGEPGTVDNMYGTTIPMSSSDSTKVATAISEKADKVTSAISGNFAGLDNNGNLTDSGHKHSDYLTSHQDISGKVDKNQGTTYAGKVLGIDSDGYVTPVPFSGEDFTGATASTAGVHGYVPAPSAGDQNMVLTGGGTWEVSPGAKVYVITGTITNTSGSYSGSFSDEHISSDMKAIELELGTPSVFGDNISVTTGSGTMTIACSSVAGSSTFKASLIKVIADPTAVTSTEFDVLANRIGTLSSLTTTTKTDMVSAVNEVNSGLSTANTAITNINSKVNSLISISNRVSGTASLPSGEWVTLAEFNPSAGGTYIIVSDCGYEQHTNGIRILLVDSVETPANTEVNSVLATGRASLQKTRMFALTTTNIIYIRAYQNSGSTITASYNYQYIRFN